VAAKLLSSHVAAQVAGPLPGIATLPLTAAKTKSSHALARAARSPEVAAVTKVTKVIKVTKLVPEAKPLVQVVKALPVRLQLVAAAPTQSRLTAERLRSPRATA
jgi:hypothetical protein